MTLQITNTDSNENNLNVSKEDTEKLELLNVNSGELTDVEKRYSLSALKILKERYLLKDNDGNTCERLHELFKRVAVGVGIMDVLYDDKWYVKEGGVKVDMTSIQHNENRLKYQIEFHKDMDYKNINNVEENKLCCFDWGDGFYINPYHYERLLARYIELLKEGKIKQDFTWIESRLILPELYPEFKEKYFSKIQKFYDLMANKYFLPNTPALMNCGTKLGMNAACFTLNMEDDLHDIYQTFADAADIFKSGGGIGVNYSKLRPQGALVKGTGGVSSGTLSWLRIMDLGVVDVVKQGGKRRGAAMAILNMDHPEIEKFIDMKRDNKTLTNHNISVNVKDELFDFSEKYRKMMDKIAENAWISGDPGMVFEDNMNSNNLLKDVMGYPIDVTNPCSEISMYPYESCILASINLTKFVNESKKEFDFNKFNTVVSILTDFLDLLIDATKYPIERINKMTKNCRRIGLGFMGLADSLVKMGIKYNSKEGFEMTEYISKCMTDQALETSNLIAKTKGAFPLWYDSKYPKDKIPVINDIERQSVHLDMYKDGGLRNCSVTTVAPTGTIAMMCDISTGIEPVFAQSFTKNVTVGDFDYTQEHDPNLVTAMEMHPFDHVMAQAVAQKWITNGISKTINLPEDASPKLIEHCYVLAWALGNKGISVYRDNCKSKQVLNNTKETSIKDINPVSEYTIEVIKNLNNIPEGYKQEMLNGLNHSVDIPKELQVLTVIQCENCGEINTLERTGRTCFLCRSCGHSIGSCS